MKHKMKYTLLMSLLTALACLLLGCGTAAVPAAETTAEAAALLDGAVTQVSDVDGLLAAIEPGATICLEPGVYDLSTASGYGGKGSDYYFWSEVYDGWALVITDVTGLSIDGGSAGDVTIAAAPRYADVLCFQNCTDVSLSGLTAGHTEEDGQCTGGVLDFSWCKNVQVNGCDLYGCGVLGVRVQNSRSVNVADTIIRDCRDTGAAYVESSRDVLFDRCEIYRCEGYSGLFQFANSSDCAILNCSIYDNNSELLVYSSYSKEISMLGCRTQDNIYTKGVFFCAPYSITVDGCELNDNSFDSWYSQYGDDGETRSLPAMSPDGTELDSTALAALEYKEGMTWSADYKEKAPRPGNEARVSTVDQFLDAIAPDTTIYLASGTYDLSTASNYGSYGSEYYFWQDSSDGPQLVISNVDKLSIVGEGADSVTVSAVPRYAEVLAFENCTGLKLSGFTAGHTQAPGFCSGGVLFFHNCSGVNIDGCGLYGCGILGISCYSSADFSVKGTEIYDCSQGAVYLAGCDKIRFESCDIHDNDGASFSLQNCTGITLDGKTLPNGESN